MARKRLREATCKHPGFTLQPWQEELLRFMLWLREKHPEVDMHLVAYPWNRSSGAVMRRLRAEYEADSRLT